MFCAINDATVKSNYPMRRIEPVLRNDLTALGHYDVQMRWIKRITEQSRCSSHTAYKLGISCARPLKYKNLYGKRLEQYAGISWEFRESVQNLDVSRQKRKRRGLDGVNRINGRCVHSFI